ncbi:DUF2975 domain-containing protein [Ureibacillus thermophilus]|uniref:DUF2975 domain-containing protein n=1 Tax=Ureibacillus thermophilus TaxID=367743 RepID=A0A4P6UV37_9BACL|nr:DUF2975 domain-containing protein [Ureibacillus thermophilus]QBK26687.1 DUF2975 domain-containing protein [Ureibacillus thermophilus]
MESAMKAKQFLSFIKGLNIVFTIILFLTILGTVFLLILIGGAILTSEQFVLNLMRKGDISASLDLNGLKIIFGEPDMNLFHYDKSLVILFLFTFLFYDSIVLAIIFLVTRFLKSILDGDIFTLTNSRRIEWIGYCIIFLSVTFKSNGAFFYIV